MWTILERCSKMLKHEILINFWKGCKNSFLSWTNHIKKNELRKARIYHMPPLDVTGKAASKVDDTRVSLISSTRKTAIIDGR